MPRKYEPQPNDEVVCDYAGALHPSGCGCGAVEVED